MIRAVGICIFALSGAAPARPALDVRLIEEGPEIDGRLDDECWKEAPALTAFKQVLPVEGAPPSEKTEVRVVYTHDTLYIAARCFDSEPDRIVVKTLSRDSEFSSDDVFKVVLDAFNRGRDGYYFSVNPAGARTDALFGSFSSFNRQWDTVWYAKARVDGKGWSAELAIPFKSLSFDPKSEVWGANFERIVRRKQETIRWTAISTAKRVTSLEDLGELRGLRNLRQGIGLQFKPYLRGKYPRIVQGCLILGKSMGLNNKELYSLKLSATFHDIGLLGVPDKLLLQEDKLTPQQRNQLLSHHIGMNGRIVSKAFPDFPEAAEGIWYHHERPDGRGPYRNRQGSET